MNGDRFKANYSVDGGDDDNDHHDDDNHDDDDHDDTRIQTTRPGFQNSVSRKSVN